MRTRFTAIAAALLWAAAGPALAGDYTLVIEKKTMSFTGRERPAITINGTIPGPALHWREGEDVTINVVNRLDEPTSVHWHGIILPNAMDGVPGLTFDGIAPGQTFTYRFTVRQNGTYWYHSHSGLQEQSGVYGPLVIAPAGEEPYRYDRDYVVMLSDWTDEDPHAVLANLKKQSDYYNYGKRTAVDFFRDISRNGLGATVADRLEWGEMRMDPTDIADVTGATYTYLTNGTPPGTNWTALYKPGERVRLRFINGSAMTHFDVRIPGLKMTVVQADGQNVRPVPVDEFRIAVAETYDVLVEPEGDRAYTIFAAAMDRSGYARGTLAPRPGMSAEIPDMQRRPLLTMKDMGMDHGSMGGMDHGAMGHGAAEPKKPDAMKGMDHGAMGHGAAAPKKPDAMKAMDHGASGSAPNATHGPDDHGPGNSMVAEMPANRLGEPGAGLENTGGRVLVYTDLRSLKRNPDLRKPGREIELHLTGNMERFMWSFDGKKYSEAEPIVLKFGERVRFTFVNDTMMNHPMHLHGMWSDLENGGGANKPRKHTINVKPGERLSFDVTADAVGKWAFHCHLLYHMETGMFREVIVVKETAEVRP
jgi:CopA family copper-resistance protein